MAFYDNMETWDGNPMKLHKNKVNKKGIKEISRINSVVGYTMITQVNYIPINSQGYTQWVLKDDTIEKC